MEIYIKQTTGKTQSVMVNPSDTIGKLKEYIIEKLDYPFNNRLIFAGKSIDDINKTLDDFFISPESQIHLLLSRESRSLVYIVGKYSCELDISGNDTIKFIKEMIKIQHIPVKMKLLYYKQKILENNKPFHYYQDCRYHCCCCAHGRIELFLEFKNEKIAYNSITADSILAHKSKSNNIIDNFSPIILENSDKEEILNECYKSIYELENKINQALCDSKELIQKITIETNKTINQITEIMNVYLNVIKIVSNNQKVKVIGKLSQEERFISSKISKLEKKLSFICKSYDKFEVDFKHKNPELNFKEYFDNQISSSLIAYVKDKKLKCLNIKTFGKFRFNNLFSSESIQEFGICSLSDFSLFFCSKTSYYLFYPNQAHILQYYYLKLLN